MESTNLFYKSPLLTTVNNFKQIYLYKRKPKLITTSPMLNYFMKTCLLTVFLFMIVFNLNAQSSFDLRIDGLVNGNFIHTYGDKIVPCADGGFFLTGTINHDNNFVLKTDSVGQIEWSYKLNPGSYRHAADIIATNDSGFYFMRNDEDGQFGRFYSPSIARVDKLGNVIKSKLIPFSQYYEGHQISFCEVDSSNNDLFLAGTFSEYNGTNGSCCYQLYAFKMDSSLNVVFSTHLDNAVPGILRDTDYNFKKVYLSNQASGYIITGVSDWPVGNNSYVYFLDSIGNLVGVKSFNGLFIEDFVQVGNSLFFISAKTYSPRIVKTDLAGNTIWAKEIQVSGNLKPDRIEKKSNNELIITGVLSSLPPNPITSSTFFMVTDTSCNVIYAKNRPTGNPYYIGDAGLPVAHLNSILMARFDTLGHAIFEKINLANSFCNYSNLTVSTIPVSVVDAAPSFATIPYPLPFVNDTMTFYPEYFNYSSPCLSSGLEDANSSNSLHYMFVNPNPATEVINLVNDDLMGKSCQVTVFNITGEAILESELDSQHREISVTGLSPGIYFVNVRDDNKQYNSKFVKL